MAASISAFFRACLSLLHPRMLALLVLPLLVSLLVMALVAIFIWEPMSAWVSVRMLDPATTVGRAYQWAAGWGLGGIKQVLLAFIVILFFVPLAFILGLGLIAVLAMPVVLRHLGRGTYRDVMPAGSFSVAASLFNSLVGLLIFLPVYLLSVPLWLLPLVGLLIPWLCWSWLTARIMRFDSLVEHASPAERQHLIERHRGAYFILGMMLSALNFLPLMVLVTPLLSALAYGHFSMTALRDLRASGFTDPVRLH